ncbi:putative nitrilase [Exidia glandulosa HHB12029]|uniref:Putative nitrilase n=1 Tax=Exidia glandulosa HHB12029 TaxID=1314781 RepID=A0A165N6Q7_EXIGL|nr:putative nitrilase [Exidia glandulosa HHB12029]
MAAIVAKPFRLALIQLGNVTANKTANLAHAREMILRAATESPKKPDLVVLPECFNSPYGHVHFPQYAEEINYTPGKRYDTATTGAESIKMLAAVAKEAGVWLIGGSIPERDPATQKLYNTATVYDPEGTLVAQHRKVHLFDIDIPGKITFQESKTLSAGTSVTTFETPFGKIGLAICYDVRFPELAMLAGRQGCVAMIYPGAFNLTTGPLHWELLQRARAVDNQIFVAMCSPARDMNAEYHAWGHSTVVDPMGHVFATTEHDEAIVYADIDPEILRSARAGIPVTVHRRFDVYTDVKEV